MSGVTGYWGYACRDFSEDAFAAFTHSLTHRGPDGFGIEHFPEARLWLGHRRLAIFDISERARQPMSYAGGRYWLTYDGEVYNYVELREELRSLGHCFVSESDSEVILAAYAQWGQDCQLRFNGIWAFAIWDTQDRRLFLSRDRFGVKPLYYSNYAGAFVFASELKAFLALPWVDGAFDPKILAETLTNVSEQEAFVYTLLPGTFRLPAGHTMLIEAHGKVQINTWWNTLDHLPKPPARFEEQVEEFRSLLLDACRLCLRGNRPAVIEQSGGLDSSAIACVVADLDRGAIKSGSQARRAYVASFPDTPFDESNQARIVIERTGMLAHFENIDARRALNNIEQVIFDHEVLFHFPYVAPWILYDSMRKSDIRVSLGGLDPDTLLGGSHQEIGLALDSAAAAKDVRRYWELRRILRGLDGGNLRIARAKTLGEIRWLTSWQLARWGLLEPLRAVRARLLSRHVDTAIQLTRGNPVKPKAVMVSLDPRVANMPPNKAMHFADFHVELQTYLANFDRNAMAHGVQVRMPFMDWRLVTYCFALPETSRYGNGYTKLVLRLATEGLVPDQIRLHTRKMAFMSPLDNWARGALKTWLLDLCTSRSFLESAVWNGPLVRTIVERATAGRASIVPVWPILHAYVLQRAFIARARNPSATSAAVSA